MRRKVIAGNWKMNKNLSESVSLISEIVNKIKKIKTKVDIIICPPFTSLDTAGELIKNSSIKLGAQNMHSEDSGAYTGEISAAMLKSIGCEYVILGHSERRTIFHENDEMINKKMKKALENNLKPIFCIGESLEEREKGITFDIIKEQLERGLTGINNTNLENIIIAYEPVWAIGTGKTATPSQAQEVHEFIRKCAKENLSNSSAENLIIQYGGSVKPENSAELLNQPDIDGALIGGACLIADSFVKIISSI
ncbi:MAG: triose-phosphate isomerase [Ignavibacteria bacterium RBG_13_36_8]|nr:MAG: triose-phosphate isomerase [Ignavibacteria bacterium RBG_13_36_8]